MSEPSTGTSDIEHEPENADDASTSPESPIDLDIDQDKVDAWNEVKSDYEVDPGGEPVPNSMDQGATDTEGP